MKYLYLLYLLTTCHLMYSMGTPMPSSMQHNPSNPSCDFKPNFFGTLLEWAPYNANPGQFDITYALFGGVVYGFYDNQWGQTFTHPYGMIDSQIYMYLGLTKSIQLECFLEPVTVFVNNQSKTLLFDSNLGFGFQFLWDKKNTPLPNLRFDSTIIIPTGTYEHLDPLLLHADETGRGAYGVTCVLVVDKTFYNIPCHPYNLALNINYSFFGNAHVHGINVYSQGLDISGLSKPGSVLLIELATEYAFSKYFNLALDVQYNHTFPTKFYPNHTPRGLSSPIILSSADLVTVVPALEFVINSKLALYLGANCSLIGRNTLSFATLNFSLDLLF